MGLGQIHFRDQCALIFRVNENPLNIRKENQLLCVQSRSNGTGRVIRIDVIALVILPKSDGRDHRNKIVLNERL